MEKAKSLGIQGDYGDLTGHPSMRAEVEKIINSKNEKLARFETIKKLVILDHDFSMENGDLTPTMKVKRKNSYEKYGQSLEELYSEKQSGH